MKTYVILSGLVCGLAVTLHAQELSPGQSVAVPSQPFVDKAPQFARWNVVTKIVEAQVDKSPAPEASPDSSPPPSPTPVRSRNKRASKPPSKFPESTPTDSRTPEPTPSTTGLEASSLGRERTVSITKTKTIRYESSTTKGADNSERWCLPGIQVTIRKSGIATVSLPGDGQDSAYFDYSQSDFEGFDWLSDNNFVGIKTVDDQQCYVFHEKAKKLRGSYASTERVACINTDTRLPVTLQENDELSTYHFELAPTAMLKPPAAVTTKLEEWRKSIEQAELMPAKP